MTDENFETSLAKQKAWRTYPVHFSGFWLASPFIRRIPIEFINFNLSIRTIIIINKIPQKKKEKKRKEIESSERNQKE